MPVKNKSQSRFTSSFHHHLSSERRHNLGVAHQPQSLVGTPRQNNHAVRRVGIHAEDVGARPQPEVDPDGLEPDGPEMFNFRRLSGLVGVLTVEQNVGAGAKVVKRPICRGIGIVDLSRGTALAPLVAKVEDDPGIGSRHGALGVYSEVI